MSKTKYRHTKGIAAGIAFLMSAAFCFAPQTSAAVQAEENYGEDIETVISVSNENAAPLSGMYTVPEGWSEDSEKSTQEISVYRQDAYQGAADTSMISCSYIDTNYSVLEYEQLRDMLTSNLLYSNVNAKISTSASYTLAKDYLYIVTVDDASLDYRDIYYYVVGDYRCFSAAVKEYRAEADQAKAAEEKTPQETGQKISEEFVWNAF